MPSHSLTYSLTYSLTDPKFPIKIKEIYSLRHEEPVQTEKDKYFYVSIQKLVKTCETIALTQLGVSRITQFSSFQKKISIKKKPLK